MPFFGHPRWPKNPKYCTGCFGLLRAQHGGAEVECSLLYADVRGSIALAEQMTPTDFNHLLVASMTPRVSIIHRVPDSAAQRW
jgi:hypothetical protein